MIGIGEPSESYIILEVFECVTENRNKTQQETNEMNEKRKNKKKQFEVYSKMKE